MGDWNFATWHFLAIDLQHRTWISFTLRAFWCNGPQRQIILEGKSASESVPKQTRSWLTLVYQELCVPVTCVRFASVWPQVGNAVKSTLHGAALKSNNKEGARSIQVEITPTSSRISRNAVTSLSIRGHRWKRHGKTSEQRCWDLWCSEKSFIKFRD